MDVQNCVSHVLKWYQAILFYLMTQYIDTIHSLLSTNNFMGMTAAYLSMSHTYVPKPVKHWNTCSAVFHRQEIAPKRSPESALIIVILNACRLQLCTASCLPTGVNFDHTSCCYSALRSSVASDGRNALLIVQSAYFENVASVIHCCRGFVHSSRRT